MRKCGPTTQAIRKTGFNQRLFPREAFSSPVHVRGIKIPANLREIKPGFLIPTMKPMDLPKKDAGTAAAQPAEAGSSVEQNCEEAPIDFSNVVIEQLY